MVALTRVAALEMARYGVSVNCVVPFACTLVTGPSPGSPEWTPWDASTWPPSECKRLQVMPIGSGPGAADLVIGEVLRFHIDDALVDDRGQVDPRKLRTIARLGGDYYCRSTVLFEMQRPQ
jgi:NAD(P)-dependent dehydrogenase (short-subunit alcohol dehydrogenase family)